ncbi:MULTISPECIES: threonine/serine ThrE exporter family protein [unclassified Luteococcus]|uniref:threonine/serine ThrE exporter family protein n=1 Tax=unclassified Luteococcus TaxID=2639923 RepID=UPI00313D7B5F
MNPDAPARDADQETTVRRLLAYAGASLIAGGATVTDAENEVRRLGRHFGYPDVQVSGYPTSISLSLASGEPCTIERIEGGLRLDQSMQVGDVRRDLMAGRLSIDDGVAALAVARHKPHLYGLPGFFGGLFAVSMGICLIMQPAWPNVLLAGLCSLLVSLLMQASGRHALLAALLPTLAAFVVSLAVLGAWRLGLIDGPLRTLICPIAVLLPGALLSTGIAELATGALVSGTARFFHGIVQLLLFALGVVAAGLVLGVPPSELTNVRLQQIGLWSLPLGLAMISVGITLSESVPWRMSVWTTLVLSCTFLTQMLGQTYGGSLPVGAFCGAVVASFASTALEATRSKVPRLITFLPSFWLLVPGTLGLMGITTLGLGTGQSEAVIGVLALVTSIALGLLVGSALALPLKRVARRMRHLHLLRR